MTGAETRMHPGDATLTEGPEAHFASCTDPMSAMRALGWEAQVAERKRFLRERVDACSIDRALHDGDVIELGGGLDLEVVSTPGHTPGSATLLVRSLKLAFTGDAVQVWGSAPGVLPLYYHPMAYRNSLLHLMSLQVETLCLGHDFQWSKVGDSSGPVRRGDDVKLSLCESLQFVDLLRQVVRASAPATSLAEVVKSIAESLPPPFRIKVRRDGTFSAASASTIISQLREDGINP
jgi:glyoxylase-like metal-dependent hydrolase (beta-lactamase superfamily II)